MKIVNLPELLARCDGSFIPRRLDDFIGRQIIERQSGDTWVGARLIAELLAQGVQLANANQRSPLKYLINGRPGLGKSALVAYLQQLLGCNKWNTIKFNGTQCKVADPASCASDICWQSPKNVGICCGSACAPQCDPKSTTHTVELAPDCSTGACNYISVNCSSAYACRTDTGVCSTSCRCDDSKAISPCASADCRVGTLCRGVQVAGGTGVGCD